MFWLVVLAAVVIGAVTLYYLRGALFFRKQIERSLKMVPIVITLPRSLESKEERERHSVKELIGRAESIFNTIAGVYEARAKSYFFGQKHIAFEVVAKGRQISFYAAVPISILDLTEKAITGAYPEAEVAEIEEHNIFSAQSEIKGVYGVELKLRKHSVYPIRTYQEIESDPFAVITNSLGKLEPTEGAAIQILVRPVGSHWIGLSRRMIRKIENGKAPYLGFLGYFYGAFDMIGNLFKFGRGKEPEREYRLTDQDKRAIELITKKTSKPGFQTTIRVLASSSNEAKARATVGEITAAFGQLTDPLANGLIGAPRPAKKLATSFIFRFFPPTKMILNSEELATIFHLPEGVETPFIKQAASKRAPAPVDLPDSGLVLGQNIYRGEERPVRLTQDDKRRHAYVLGQTGTGKSTLLENMIIQEIRAGAGVAVVDPHGDLVEKIIGEIPPERAEEVIYFDPADLEYPVGVNLFEWKTPDQKDLLIAELINMLYKLYDPHHTGIVGPRFEHWLRNAALTLMADPAGATLVDVPKIFTDNEFLKTKLAHVTDPLVLDFWTKEMAQTSDFHKSEILGWFVSKFGAFVSNQTMRNILGQVKSAFDVREAMDQGKIVLVNLSKGRIGELNSSLLGMIFVTKIQLAAMSRVDTPEAGRRDFTLYVDEFQNFSTDSFASILSEARKYRLSLIVANQFIAQLKDEIRNAVFGNVGTLVSYRVGAADAEFVVKQFEPQFAELDLINLENFNAVIKLMIGGIPSKPFSLSASPPLAAVNAELSSHIRELSRLKYGAKRELVEYEIGQRLK